MAAEFGGLFYADINGIHVRCAFLLFIPTFLAASALLDYFHAGRLPSTMRLIYLMIEDSRQINEKVQTSYLRA